MALGLPTVLIPIDGQFDPRAERAWIAAAYSPRIRIASSQDEIVAAVKELLEVGRGDWLVNGVDEAIHLIKTTF
jgi:hypothetical protein